MAIRKQGGRPSPKRVLGALVALSVTTLLLASTIGLAEKYVATRRRVNDLKAEASALAEKRESLAARNAYIQTPDGQERELREKYNVVLPGEGVVIITEPADLTQTGPSTRVGRWWDALLRGLGIRRD